MAECIVDSYHKLSLSKHLRQNRELKSVKWLGYHCSEERQGLDRNYFNHVLRQLRRNSPTTQAKYS